MENSKLNYHYHVRRLAMGLTFEDEMRRAQLAYPVRVEIERGIPHQSPNFSRFYTFKQSGRHMPKGLLHHGTRRYSLSFYPGIQKKIVIRIYDYDRYYVPRRLEVPLLTLAEVLAIEENVENNFIDYFLGRVRNVVMFPGAAYHSISRVTGLRGRVLRNNEPMRWVYVEARSLTNDVVIARTRGDDRGEFLLLLPPRAALPSELPVSGKIDLRVLIAGPIDEPTAESPDVSVNDVYWDLPKEVLPPIEEVDNVSNGKSFPNGYANALSAVRVISFQFGRLLTGREVDDFNFSFP